MSCSELLGTGLTKILNFGIGAVRVIGNLFEFDVSCIQ